MKKVFLTLTVSALVLALGSCGGSSTAPTKETAFASMTILNTMQGMDPTASASATISSDDPSYTLDCSLIEDFDGNVIGKEGIVNYYAVSDSDTEMTVTAELVNCTTEDNICNLGDIVGNGSIITTINFTDTSVTMEVRSEDLEFDYNSETITCPISISGSFSDAEFDFNGTVCGVDIKTLEELTDEDIIAFCEVQAAE